MQKLPYSAFQEQLNDYRQTISAYRTILPKEDIDQLEDLINRLEHRTISISAFGVTNSGKSALLNSLLGYDNNTPQHCPFRVGDQTGVWSETDGIKNGKQWKDVSGLTIVVYDTPGIGSDFSHHAAVASEIARKSDVILFVIKDDVTVVHKGDLDAIMKSDKPVIGVINQVDSMHPSFIAARKDYLFRNFPIKKDRIVCTAGFPPRDAPNVMDLTSTIFALVQAEGVALIAQTVNAGMMAGEQKAAEAIRKKLEAQKAEQERILQGKIAQLDVMKRWADVLIDRYAKAAATAAGVIPFGLDAITSSAISLTMMGHAASNYNKTIDATTIGNMLKEFVSSFFSILAVSGLSLAAYIALSKGAKTNPWTYLAGMVMDFVFTYFIVSAVGQTFSFYCYHDLSWGDKKNAETVLREYIRKNIKEMFLDKLPPKVSKLFDKYNFEKI